MSVSTYPIKNALVSVSDKTGLEQLCQALVRRGVTLYSTGGTRQFLLKQGLACQSVEELTEFPEMMDGRVKTLHPKVFGGVLARRDNRTDISEASKNGIPLFDLVVVNLYPFWEHQGKTIDEQTSFIDIGGPSLIRAASKNSKSVAVLSDPSEYPAFIEHYETHHGATTLELRRRLAARTFARTASYDAMIASEWGKDLALPTTISLSPQQTLRYGENPHQKAAWSPSGKTAWRVLQGKELSYNNLLDAEAAVRIVEEFDKPTVCIVKHNNPCGVASLEASVAAVYQKALACDDKSAFGGIVAVNREVDAEAANAMAALFLEVVIAPKFSAAAVETFSKKKNLRLIEWEKPEFASSETRPALGGWLVQERDAAGIPPELKTVTQKSPSDATLNDLKFAWLVCKHVRSNAIVVAKDGQTIGIGAGQMSRVDAVRIALEKSKQFLPQGAVLASDAFFPFRDNIDLMQGTGITAIIQPGGSVKDAEVIDAANGHGISMVFTGERHFRH